MEITGAKADTTEAQPAFQEISLESLLGLDSPAVNTEDASGTSPMLQAPKAETEVIPDSLQDFLDTINMCNSPTTSSCTSDIGYESLCSPLSDIDSSLNLMNSWENLASSWEHMEKESLHSPDYDHIREDMGSILGDLYCV